VPYQHKSQEKNKCYPDVSVHFILLVRY